MRKTFSTIIFALSLITPSMAEAQDPFNTEEVIKINMMCQQIDTQKNNEGIHRTGPLIPNVFIDQTYLTLYFENPCYECTLEIVIPGTDSAVYTYSIPDGDNVVTLPEWLSGQYELHIHRGNFCFWGVIEL